MKTPVAALLLLTLSFPAYAVTEWKRVKVSWYDSKSECWRNPHPECPMANTESIYKAERNGKLFAAAWGLPFGTKVEIRYQGRRVIVTITDRGPAKRLRRDLDLCKKAFSRLANPRAGLLWMEMRVLKEGM